MSKSLAAILKMAAVCSHFQNGEQTTPAINFVSSQLQLSFSFMIIHDDDEQRTCQAKLVVRAAAANDNVVHQQGKIIHSAIFALQLMGAGFPGNVAFQFW